MAIIKHRLYSEIFIIRIPIFFCFAFTATSVKLQLIGNGLNKWHQVFVPMEKEIRKTGTTVPHG